jgi:uncharacterized protein (TIGR04222 family)
LVTLTFVVTGCQAIAELNPLNFTGPEFLTLYFWAALVVSGLAFCLRALLRRPDYNPKQRPVQLNAYETAYLAEGVHHAVDTAIASLVQQGYVIAQSKQRRLVLNQSLAELSHPLEQAVATAIQSDGRIGRVRQRVVRATDAIRKQLQQLDLLVSQDQSFKAQVYPTLMITALLGLGIAKIYAGISVSQPVGYLTILCVFITIIGLLFLLAPTHRSCYGDRVLDDLQSRTRLHHSTLYNNVDSQLPLAFALFGVTVLAGSVFTDLRQIFRPSSNGSDNGGDRRSRGRSRSRSRVWHVSW